MKNIFLIFFVSIMSLSAQSQKNKAGNSILPIAEIKKLAYTDSARLTDIFMDIHKHPELAFMETRTSAIVAKQLKDLGYEVVTGIGKTGVVGILKNGTGPIVMYRADMDCNAVKEVTGLPYASSEMVARDDGTEVPVMHACGHDAHTTWMIGVAKIMIELKGRWKGTLIFVGQPAEEEGEGAEAMVNDKMYERGVPEPDYLFGMHTAPVPVGVISNGVGYRMAGTDQLDVTFYGVGGHGSSPHLAKDPVVMTASAIMEYQTIISRSIDPQNAAVLTVGSVQTGTDNNVIPGSALLKINLRWFNENDRNILLRGINRIDSSIAFAYGLPPDLYPKTVMKGMAYPLKNDTAMVYKVNTALAQIPSLKNITELPAIMGSEDFHHLVIHNKKAIYDYMLVGIANHSVFAQAAKEGKIFPFHNHNGNFWVDLSSIPLGAELGATVLMQLFNN